MEKTTRMEELGDLSVGQEVVVRVKVVKVGEMQKVVSKKKGIELRKVDCVVGDSSGSGCIVLWEDDVGKLVQGNSYVVRGAGVGVFDGVKYLSVGVMCEIFEVEDMGEIADVECGDVECIVPCKEVRGEIEGVEYYEEYTGCYSCKAKVRSSDDFVGECSKCGMVMKLRRGVKKMAARVIVCCEESGDVSSVSLFDDVIQKIIEGVEGSDVKRRLVAAPPLCLNVDKRNVVIGVKKL